MFTLFKRLTLAELICRQAPTLIGALIIAELFYKWHSFLLETGGFLATWMVLDALAGVIARLIGGKPRPEADRTR